MMAVVQEQKDASDNEISAQKVKSAKGKRKHVATGNPRGRPPMDPSKDGDRDCRLLRPRPNYLAHVRRLSIIDVVLSVCGKW